LLKGHKGLSKILFVSIVIAIVSLISVVSFAAVKTYDAKTRTVTILSPLPVAELQLIENTDQCLINCYAVIRLKVNSQVTIPASPENNYKWDFVKQDAKLGLQEYRFELFSDVQKQEPRYSAACSPYTENVNSTTITFDNCTQVQNGTDSYIVKEYVPFEFYGYTFQQGKDYYIKLKGKKYAQFNNNVEWIPTFYGIQINEWAWWNDSWLYKREINITANGNNATNGTLRITLNTTNFNYTKANTTGKDIRFVNSSDVAGGELSYYIEQWNSSGNSTIWVTLPHVSNTTVNTIYMYYGNNNTESTSNATATFVLYTHMYDNETVGNNAAGYRQCSPENLPTKYQIANNVSLTTNNSLRFEGTYSARLCSDNPAGLSDQTHLYIFSMYPNISADNISLGIRWFVNRSDAKINDLMFGNNTFKYYDGGSIQTAADAPAGQWYTVWTYARPSQLLSDVYLNGQIVKANLSAFGWAAYSPAKYSIIQEYVSGHFESWIDSIFASNTSYPLPNISIGVEVIRGASEADARQAIEDGIRASLGNVTIYTDRTIYLRYLNGTQAAGKFDKFTSNGTKRWAFNYVTSGETATNMQNLTSNVYVWEKSALATSQIRNEVETLINATK